MSAGPWNWLELAKLLAALLTPAALAIFGIYVHRVTKRFEHLQWRSQKLVEKRLDIYDDLAPLLNDVLCYFTYVGSWKDLDPPRVVALKRTIDKKIHLAAPLFSETFFAASMEFQSLCFETYTGWGRDALLKTKLQRRKEARPNDWKEEWAECFSNSESDPKEIRRTYFKIIESFAVDIGVHPSFVVPLSGGVPGNIR
jgi:hypothetical protein